MRWIVVPALVVVVVTVVRSRRQRDDEHLWTEAPHPPDLR